MPGGAGGIADAGAEHYSHPGRGQVPVENGAYAHEQDAVGVIVPRLGKQGVPEPAIQLIAEIAADRLEQVNFHRPNLNVTPAVASMSSKPNSARLDSRRSNR